MLVLLQKRLISTQQLSTKVTMAFEPVLYYSRVSASFLKQVATHSKLLQFPDIGKATQGESLFKHRNQCL